jgi:hypothetical protein
LYTYFAEGVDIVAGIEGDQSAAAFTGRGRKRRKTATQKQIVVRWEPAIMQGWMVKIAKDMGYRVDHVQLVGREAICRASGLATECCGPNSHIVDPEESDDLIICDTCCRRYHIDCLTLDAHPKRSPNHHGPTDHPNDTQGGAQDEATYAPWTCKECRTNNFNETTLPLDLRHYLVHWKPQAENQSDLSARNPALTQMI